MSAASKKYGIPRTTLVEKRSGKSAINATNGRPLVMSKEEEDTVLKYTQYRVQTGHPIDRITVLAIATAVHRKHCEANGIEPKFNLTTGPSNNWWLNFKKRNGICLRKPDPLDRARKNSIDKATVQDFFTQYQDILDKYGLTNAPHRIYNADETGFTLDPQRKKIVTFKSMSGASSSVRAGTRDHISIMECTAADGSAIPPLMIFSKCFPSSAYRLDGPPNALYATTPAGYIEGPVFLSWLKSCFHRFATQERPVLLLADQHSTHMSQEVIEFAIENDIVILTFPPHATHFLQPMDAKAGPFRALKDKFEKVLHQLSVAKPNFYVTKATFPKIYRTVRDEGLTMAAVRRGFKNTGIYPVNLDALDSRWFHMNDAPGATSENATVSKENSNVARELLQEELDVLALAARAVQAQETPLMTERTRVMRGVSSLT
ncbi:TIGD2 [Branchiostoma lanceolatum]|uniref:TIGD2 protein n=1 Tax=Branchiostoma lanceolatum TaxID=7740 RepID=A0A8J9ZS16_BRALA|nr:TIGD2 [Branchiostoma lanceolatum]